MCRCEVWGGEEEEKEKEKEKEEEGGRGRKRREEEKSNNPTLKVRELPQSQNRTQTGPHCK